jgi:hypothetical protein
MNCPAPLDEMPAPDSELEDALFALAGHVFLQTSDASACLDAMERVPGGQAPSVHAPVSGIC